MAASKPTFWLSQFTKPFSHLIFSLGPCLTIWAVSLLSLDLRTQGLTLLGQILCFRSFLELGRVKNPPYPLSALHHKMLLKGYTSIYFAENQLSPSLISLSPLCTSHPRLLPQAWVQPFIVYYDRFQLAHA